MEFFWKAPQVGVWAIGLLAGYAVLGLIIWDNIEGEN